jgi:hypothetical protein
VTLYYIKQDNTVWGCGEPGCCGETWEQIEESFVECECEQIELDMPEHLQFCAGGGEILKWRKAKRLEIQAWNDGKDDGFQEGSDWGIDWQKKQGENK